MSDEKAYSLNYNEFLQDAREAHEAYKAARRAADTRGAGLAERAAVVEAKHQFQMAYEMCVTPLDGGLEHININVEFPHFGMSAWLGSRFHRIGRWLTWRAI